MDALPSPPPAIIVQRAQDSAPLILFGFMATGQEGDMAALERAATALGYKCGRSENDRNEPEVMVMFQPGSPRAQSLKLYRDARSGRFGALRLEVVVIPVSAAVDGIDFDREVTAEQPAYIAEPKD